MTAETKTEGKFEEAYNKAVMLLSTRMLTVGELHEKLRTRGFAQPVIVAVIRQLELADFINDQRYAQIFVENLKRYKDYGHYGIKTRLIKKKIPSEIIQEVLGQFFTAEDELEVAVRVAKKLKRQGRMTYEKAARSFATRGFSSDVVREVLKQFVATKGK